MLIDPLRRSPVIQGNADKLECHLGKYLPLNDIGNSDLLWRSQKPPFSHYILPIKAECVCFEHRVDLTKERVSGTVLAPAQSCRKRFLTPFLRADTFSWARPGLPAVCPGILVLISDWLDHSLRRVREGSVRRRRCLYFEALPGSLNRCDHALRSPETSPHFLGLTALARSSNFTSTPLTRYRFSRSSQ